MKSFFKRICLISLSCIATISYASGDGSRYMCVPKKITFQQESHSCYYAVHSIDVNVAKKGNSCSSGKLIGYICQRNRNLSMIMVDEEYHDRDILNNTFNNIVKSEFVEIEVGGKTVSGAYWDGVKRVKKDDPDYYCGFGDYFVKVLESNYWKESRNSKKNISVCLDKLYHKRKTEN